MGVCVGTVGAVWEAKFGGVEEEGCERAGLLGVPSGCALVVKARGEGGADFECFAAGEERKAEIPQLENTRGERGA